jgi:hypothetical protein
MLSFLLALPLLVFHGNVALVENVYRTALDLPAGTKATSASARAVAARLQKFLHDSGYVLASVRARAERDQIVVDVDEGRLDKSGSSRRLRRASGWASSPTKWSRPSTSHLG